MHLGARPRERTARPAPAALRRGARGAGPRGHAEAARAGSREVRVRLGRVARAAHAADRTGGVRRAAADPRGPGRAGPGLARPHGRRGPAARAHRGRPAGPGPNRERRRPRAWRGERRSTWAPWSSATSTSSPQPTRATASRPACGPTVRSWCRPTPTPSTASSRISCRMRSSILPAGGRVTVSVGATPILARPWSRSPWRTRAWGSRRSPRADLRSIRARRRPGHRRSSRPRARPEPGADSRGGARRPRLGRERAGSGVALLGAAAGLKSPILSLVRDRLG